MRRAAWLCSDGEQHLEQRRACAGEDMCRELRPPTLLPCSFADRRINITLQEGDCEWAAPGLSVRCCLLHVACRVQLRVYSPPRSHRCFNGAQPIAGELRYQALVEPEYGWPPAVISKGEGVAFTGGSPIAVLGPQVPGFRRELASGLWGQPGFSCNDTLK